MRKKKPAVEKKKRKKRGSEPSSTVAGLTVADDAVDELRADPVVKAVLKSFKKNAQFSVNFDAIHAELREITKTSKSFAPGKIQLNDLTSLKHAAKMRVFTQAQRDRVTEICNEMRSLHAKSHDVWMATTAYIRQSEVLSKFYASAVDPIIYAALREVAVFVDRAESMIDEAMAVIYNLDARTRTIDDWVNINKQYVYMSGMQPGTQSGIDDDERREKRLGSGSFSAARRR